MQILFHSNIPYTITNINDNIKMNNKTKGSMNADSLLTTS